MTKIYEALENARRERRQNRPSSDADAARDQGRQAPEEEAVEAEAPATENPQGEAKPAEAGTSAQASLDGSSRVPAMIQEERSLLSETRRAPFQVKLELEDTMAGLYRSITTMLPAPGGKIVQLMGTRNGEGASVLIREFAKVAAYSLGKSVLLLDSDQSSPCQLQHFNIDPDHGWEECVRQGRPFEDTIHRIGDERLYVSQVSVVTARAPRVTDLPQIGEFFESLRQNFDLILVDAPAATTSSEGLVLAQVVDGVVLVIEAEKTRRQVAQNARDLVESHGGYILGAILNKRRYPIPSFFYNRL